MSLAPTSRPVALVTGGKRRLGLAIAQELARGGHDIVLHCHGQAELAGDAIASLRDLGARAVCFEADLRDAAATETLVPRALETYGRLDVLVNNASMFRWDDLETFDVDTLIEHLRVNTAAPLMLARGLYRHLQSRAAGGVVVNILDQKLWNPNPDHLSYTLSKRSLEESTTMLAMALAPRVRVCGVAPGITLPSDVMTDAQFEAAHRMTPLGRSSTAPDIARAVRYLVESPAVTGTTLLVDGGQHLTGQRRDVVFLAADATATAPATEATK